MDGEIPLASIWAMRSCAQVALANYSFPVFMSLISSRIWAKDGALPVLRSWKRVSGSQLCNENDETPEDDLVPKERHLPTDVHALGSRSED